MDIQGIYNDIEEFKDIDKKKQLSIDEKITDQDAKRHRNFFKSLKRVNIANTISMVAVIMIAFASVGVGLVIRNSNKEEEDTSVSLEECGDMQVTIYTDTGFYCKDCGSGEYGRLQMCEEESPTGICEKADSGCFKPVL